MGQNNSPRRKSAKLLNVPGKTFGHWLALWPYESVLRQSRVVCMCVCGTIRDVPIADLIGGLSTNCGCQKRGLKPAHTAWIEDGKGPILTPYGTEHLAKYGQYWKRPAYSDGFYG